MRVNKGHWSPKSRSMHCSNMPRPLERVPVSFVVYLTENFALSPLRNPEIRISHPLTATVKDDRDIDTGCLAANLTLSPPGALYKPTPRASPTSTSAPASPHPRFVSITTSACSSPSRRVVLCFPLQPAGQGRAASPSPRAKRPVEEPARGSRLELATHHGDQGAASPRPHEAAELAVAGEESEEQRNRFLVLRLYEALNARHARRAQELLAPDLEWWFHGPPERQHMMRLLTGAGGVGFVFSPRSVDAFGSTVIAEGADDARQLYWVHAWTVGPDGVITQLREYFNTDLTVTLLSSGAAAAIASVPTKQDAAFSSTSSSSSSSAGPKCLWQSRRADRAHKSLPGLVLAI